MKELMNWMKEEESGQGLVEYALIVGLIALACVAVMITAGEKVETIWTNIKNNLTTAAENV